MHTSLFIQLVSPIKPRSFSYRVLYYHGSIFWPKSCPYFRKFAKFAENGQNYALFYAVIRTAINHYLFIADSIELIVYSFHKNELVNLLENERNIKNLHIDGNNVACSYLSVIIKTNIMLTDLV